MARVLDFSDGFTSASAPASGTSTTVTGTRASPIAITAVGGISVSGVADEIIFIQGSGGAVDISASPQIEAGSVVGSRLTLIARSDTNTVLIEDGTGLSLNGSFSMSADDIVGLIWDGTNWTEAYRREN